MAAIPRCFNHARDSRFLYALAQVMELPEFDPERLMKIGFGWTQARHCATAVQYVENIEEVYNYHRPLPTQEPLALLVAKRALHKHIAELDAVDPAKFRSEPEPWDDI